MSKVDLDAPIERDLNVPPDSEEDSITMWETGRIVGSEPIDPATGKPPVKEQEKTANVEAEEESNEEIVASEEENTEALADDPEEESQNNTALERDDENPGNKKDGFQRQKEKWQSKVQQKDQQIQFLMDQLSRTQQTQTPAPAQPNIDYSKAPTLEMFGGNVEEFVKATTSYTAAVTRAQIETESKTRNYQQRLAEFKKTAADFDEVMEEVSDHPTAMRTSEEVRMFILESNSGPAVQHYLAKNINELARIDSMPPWQRFAELGKIEDRVSAKKKTASPQRQESKAPPPVKPVTGKAPAPTKDLYEMSADEVADYLEKEEQKDPRRRFR